MITLLQYPGKSFFYGAQNYYAVDSVGMFIGTIWHHTSSKSSESYSISSHKGANYSDTTEILLLHGWRFCSTSKLTLLQNPTNATKINGLLEENNGGMGGVVSKSKILMSKSKIQG